MKSWKEKKNEGMRVGCVVGNFLFAVCGAENDRYDRVFCFFCSTCSAVRNNRPSITFNAIWKCQNFFQCYSAVVLACSNMSRGRGYVFQHCSGLYYNIRPIELYGPRTARLRSATFLEINLPGANMRTLTCM